MANRVTILLVSAALFSILFFSSLSGAMAASDKKVYIVHLQRENSNEQVGDVEAKHVGILSSVVGSHEAAKDAILYSYKHGVHGFSAKLSPDEVDSLIGRPEVLAVVPSGTAQLHSGQ